LADYRVSMPVVRQALDLPEAEGLVDRVHGRGTSVRRPPQRVRRGPERYQWEKDRVLLPEELTEFVYCTKLTALKPPRGQRTR
jgi:GntR family transcriptional regulator